MRNTLFMMQHSDMSRHPGGKRLWPLGLDASPLCRSELNHTNPSSPIKVNSSEEIGNLLRLAATGVADVSVMSIGSMCHSFARIRWSVRTLRQRRKMSR